MNFKKYLTYSLVVGSLTLTSLTYTSFSDYGIVKNNEVHAAQVGNAQVSNWAVPYVEAMQKGGLVPASLQSGNLASNITREEFAELITTYVNKAGRKFERNENTQFTDTQNPLVKEAARLGIVAGVGKGKFNPKQHTNREQIATMAHRAEEIASLTDGIPDVSMFKDASQISTWAKTGVGTMVSHGAIEGTGNGMFKPKDSATKEQAIKIVAELASKNGLVTISKPAPKPLAPTSGSGLKTNGFKYSDMVLSGNVGATHYGIKIPVEAPQKIKNIIEDVKPTNDNGGLIMEMNMPAQEYKGNKLYEASYSMVESSLKSKFSSTIVDQILDYTMGNTTMKANLPKKMFKEVGLTVEVYSPMNVSYTIIRIYNK